jgi:hypothetical protein
MRFRPVAALDVGSLATQYLAGLLEPVLCLARGLEEPLVMRLEVVVLEHRDVPAAGSGSQVARSVRRHVSSPDRTGERLASVGSEGVIRTGCRHDSAAPPSAGAASWRLCMHASFRDP